MLRVLIPVINKEGALQAARHAAFLFAEHCVSEVELMEVLEPPDQGRASAFHSRGTLRLQEKRAMLSALSQTRAILDDAGVPYHWSRVFGPWLEPLQRARLKNARTLSWSMPVTSAFLPDGG
jgi:hypothetical protein